MERSGPRKILPLTVLVSLVAASAAFAYVLPGGAILRRMVNAREEMRVSGLRVDGTVSFFAEGAKSAAVALNLPADKPELQADASLSMRVPGRCRLDVSTPEGGRVGLIEMNGKHRVEGAADVPELSTLVHAVCLMLATRQSSETDTRAEIDRQLRALGVDPRATGLGRLGEQVAYTLGKGPAQFWVFKDSFLPARLKWTDAQKTAWDVKLVDYASPSAGELFPRVIEVVRNGEKLARFTVLKADSRVTLADRLFQVSP